MSVLAGPTCGGTTLSYRDETDGCTLALRRTSEGGISLAYPDAKGTRHRLRFVASVCRISGRLHLRRC